MLDVILDVAVEVATDLWPTRERPTAERPDPNVLAVQFGLPGEFTRGLNASGWLADEVLAAGVLRQGKPPSVLTAATGLVLIQLARRRSKSLPRNFVLAASARHVVAFAMTTEGDETSAPIIKIKRREIGCWPRELVGMTEPRKGLFTKGGTLVLAGERIPVTSDDDDSTNELIELLGR